MVELFQNRPPWNVPVFKRFNAHSGSILEIQYMPKSQLLVTISTDQTIKFFDPVSTSYRLTDPKNIPHARQQPGYYRALETEYTSSNTTFTLVRRLYTGLDTTCYALRILNVDGIQLDPQNPGLQSSLEWVLALKLGRAQKIGKRNT